MTDTQSRHEFTQIGKPPEEARTPEQLAEEWAEREGGYKPSDGSGFFVRTKAFLAGHRSRDPELNRLVETVEMQGRLNKRERENNYKLENEIVALKSRVECLESALKKIAESKVEYFRDPHSNNTMNGKHIDARKIASDALAQKEKADE